jgi:hypothetical protein
MFFCFGWGEQCPPICNTQWADRPSSERTHQRTTCPGTGLSVNHPEKHKGKRTANNSHRQTSANNANGQTYSELCEPDHVIIWLEFNTVETVLRVTCLSQPSVLGDHSVSDPLQHIPNLKKKKQSVLNSQLSLTANNLWVPRMTALDKFYCIEQIRAFMLRFMKIVPSNFSILVSNIQQRTPLTPSATKLGV